MLESMLDIGGQSLGIIDDDIIESLEAIDEDVIEDDDTDESMADEDDIISLDIIEEGHSIDDIIDESIDEDIIDDEASSARPGTTAATIQPTERKAAAMTICFFIGGLREHCLATPTASLELASAIVRFRTLSATMARNENLSVLFARLHDFALAPLEHVNCTPMRYMSASLCDPAGA